MRTDSFSRSADPDVLRELITVVADDRCTTVKMLVLIAEADARKLYLPQGYPSMFAFCVHELHFSDDEAYKRIAAARAARQFPVLLGAVAEGRVHLTAVNLLSPYLTPENAAGLVVAATHKTKTEIQELIAARFPRSEMLPLVEVMNSSCQLVPEPVGTRENSKSDAPSTVRLASERVEAAAPRSSVEPIAPQRFALHVSFGREAHDKLRYAQELLGHRVPAGDVAIVIERALDALIVQIEKRKLAATARPHRQPRPTASRRHVPAHVRRAVWARDGGQCTFVGEAGNRCPARTRLEYDHMDAVALGGQATVGRMRLRCRAHNQYAAECELGREFMNEKRHAAREAAAAKARAKGEALRSRAEAVAKATALREAVEAEEAHRAAAKAAAQEVIPWLRHLGYRADEARLAAELCEAIPEASLEDRVKLALTYFRPRTIPAG